MSYSVVIKLKSMMTEGALTVGIGLFSSIPIAMTTYSLFFEKNNIPITEKINELSNIQRSLKVLDDYIDKQKYSLKNYDSQISSLVSEKEKLSAAVQVDRKSVEALASIIDGNKNPLKEYGIGFIFGVISSVLGNFITRKIFKINPANP